MPAACSGKPSPLAPPTRREFLRTSAAVCCGPAAFGCLGDGTGPSSGPRLTARPGTPSLAAPVGLTALGLGSGRDGVLYVPAGYTPDRPAPLFVALHGAGGAADNWASYHDRAEARGMVLLIPDSRSTTWDVALGGFGPDVLFLDGALRHTFDRCRIDPARIALGGFSDGASYALSLGVSNGDLFSHLVAYSPGFFRPGDPVIGTPVVFVSHGTNDPILPVAASRDVIVPRLVADGYDVTYVEFDGGHEVPAVMSEQALDWVLN